MTLIQSISGIRGTIGGKNNEGLNPLSIVKYTAAYATFIKQKAGEGGVKIVVGRDARVSGEMVRMGVVGTLVGMGVEVVDAGMVTTPTVEIAVQMEHAQGGIIITASHNTWEWNALKLLDANGEFLNKQDGERVLQLADHEDFRFADVQHLGKIVTDHRYKERHIENILKLKLVDTDAIKQADFRVAIDCVNSVGGVVLPDLLYALGIKEIFKLHCNPHGKFSHNPEPLTENLREISQLMTQAKAHVGFAVDPDVDRLAIFCENGQPFGEEYTLVAVSDYVLSHTPGNTVSNLSSTRALQDVTQQYNGTYHAAPVGEVNVVKKMKETNAVIGGEGNGGVIYPPSHYGRDALVGIALFLSHLAKKRITTSQLRNTYPSYFMSKQKVELANNVNIEHVFDEVKKHFCKEKINEEDGVKIDLQDSWVHLRKSNTEPIVRIYAEAKSLQLADQLATNVIQLIHALN
jgi:phosphomannomutase